MITEGTESGIIPYQLDSLLDESHGAGERISLETTQQKSKRVAPRPKRGRLVK